MKTPMLDRMCNEQIFYIGPEGDNFEIVEACDHYYRETLTKEELKQLGEELIAMSEGRA